MPEVIMPEVTTSEVTMSEVTMSTLPLVTARQHPPAPPWPQVPRFGANSVSGAA